MIKKKYIVPTIRVRGIFVSKILVASPETGFNNNPISEPGGMNSKPLISDDDNIVLDER